MKEENLFRICDTLRATGHANYWQDTPSIDMTLSCACKAVMNTKPVLVTYQVVRTGSRYTHDSV